MPTIEEENEDEPDIWLFLPAFHSAMPFQTAPISGEESHIQPV
jgi:hypothetical protein